MGAQGGGRPAKVAKIAGPIEGQPFVEASLDELIASRLAHLTAYQDAALAARSQRRITAIRGLGNDALSRVVATQYARLLAPKDEYEVARLYAETDFLQQLGERFDGDLRLSFHLAPPLFARPGPDGRPRKIRFGAWLVPVFKGLARVRRWRGSWLDPFRFGPDRQVDRQLLADYEADLDLLEQQRRNDAAAVQLAGWPGEVRGFGPVREAARAKSTKVRETARNALMT